MKEVIELIATIKATAGEFTAAIRDVTGGLTDVAKQVDAAAREFDELNRATLDKIIGELEGTTSASSEAAKGTEKLGDAAAEASLSLQQLESSAGLRALNDGAAEAEKSMSSLDKAIQAAREEAGELGETPLDALAREIENSDAAIIALEKSIEQSTKELETLDRVAQDRLQAEIAASQKQLDALRAKSNHAKAELARLDQTPMQRLKARIKSVAEEAAATAKRVGAATAAIAGAIAGASAIAAKGALSTGSSFAELTSILEDDLKRNAQFLTDFQRGVRAISTEMVIDINEIYRAAYQARSAGIAGRDLLDFLRAAAVGAKGGVADLTAAVDAATTVMNAYSEENLKAADVFDTMFTAVLKGKLTFAQLSAVLGQVVPTAKALGVSFDELSASLAVLTLNGMPTTQAATGLRTALDNMVNPSEQAKAASKALGVEFSATALRAKGLRGFLGELSDRLKSLEGRGLHVVDAKQVAAQEAKIGALTKKLADLQEKLRGASGGAREGLVRQINEVGAALGEARERLFALKVGEEVARNATEAIIEMFGSVESKNVVFALMANDVAQLNSVMGDMANKSGAAAEAFATIKENDPGWALKQTAAEAAALKDQVGTDLLIALKDLFAALSSVTQSLREWAAENPRLSSGIIIVLTAILSLAAAIAAIVWAIGTLITSVVAIGAKLALIGALFVKLKAAAIAVGVAIAGISAPVWIAIAAIAAAVALVVVYWDEIIEATSNAMYEIGRFFWDLGENAQFVWGEIKRWGLDMISVLMDRFRSMFDWLGKKLAWLAEKLGLASETTELTGKGGVSPEEARRRNEERWNSQGGDVKKFAAGGIVTRPTLALAGEAGPEAFVPLSNGAIPVSLNLDSMGATAGPGGGSFAPNITIMQQPGESAEALARRVADVLLRRRG
jgi:TP901 family phage tail tape measure protein